VPEAQHRVGQQADLLTEAHFGQRLFEYPVEQVEGVLHRHDARKAQLVSRPQKRQQAPGMLVGQAHVADLPSATSSASATNCSSMGVAGRSCPGSKRHCPNMG
jgi:hypothetical protein